MTQRLRFEGRGDETLLRLRLSDLDKDIRLAAARNAVDQEIRESLAVNRSPENAILETLKIERIAEDPAAAAVTMPDDCINREIWVTIAEYEKAVRKLAPKNAVARLLEAIDDLVMEPA